MNRLRVFYYVYTCKGITSASENLFVTPSAVSQQLKRLEEELQAPLFTRIHKRLIPTANANKLIELVAPLIEELQVGVEQMDQERREPSGLIRLGSPIEFGSTYLPRIFTHFRKTYNKVTFDLKLDRPSALLQMMAEGEIDFAFVDEILLKPEEDFMAQFSITPLLEERVALACSRRYNDEVLKGDHSLENLLSASYITQQHGRHSISRWFEHNFGKPGVKPNIVLNVAHNRAVVTAVKSGMGLGVIVPHLVQTEIKNGNFVMIRGLEKQPTNKISIAKLIKRFEPIRETEFLKDVHRCLKDPSAEEAQTTLNASIALTLLAPDND